MSLYCVIVCIMSSVFDMILLPYMHWPGPNSLTSKKKGALKPTTPTGSARYVGAEGPDNKVRDPWQQTDHKELVGG